MTPRGLNVKVSVRVVMFKMKKEMKCSQAIVSCQKCSVIKSPEILVNCYLFILQQCAATLRYYEPDIGEESNDKKSYMRIHWQCRQTWEMIYLYWLKLF